MNLNDLKYIREVDFTLRIFTWTIIGGLLLNVVFVTTTFVVGFSNDKALLEIIMTIPYALMIATLASIMVFPFLDLREYISDRVMCKELGWDYEIDFVSKFSPDQLEKLRENYLNLTEKSYSRSQIQERQESFIGQLTRE
ncbi:hypothetical protein [Glaciecola sp. 33A]|jgi:hypothetical protein|uniref:hypothetical protein n=1 Tax=Glaciecola sp. 33A TaxID=2057807 RepID=UPI000C3243D4|nr:hypothetical protein [Glaciecola sp. 33A]PKI03728.1 hypothetical protein CXF81_00320 [Glaciecola sp. 33A]